MMNSSVLGVQVLSGTQRFKLTPFPISEPVAALEESMRCERALVQGSGSLRLLDCRLDGQMALGPRGGPPVSSEVSVKITLSNPSKGQGYWA